jgi:4,5:9,10-diseco-3-hydroxy-5,9,17-trioxoandrosta-1(10),2-diene-4-oate hydrolase
MARPGRDGIRWLFKRVFYDPSVGTEALVELLYGERSRPGNQEAMLRILRRGVTIAGIKRSIILVEELPEIKAPTLVVWGRGDAIFPVSHAEGAAKALAKGQLVVFERCGHWPHIEVRAAFNDLLLKFLNSPSPPNF